MRWISPVLAVVAAVAFSAQAAPPALAGRFAVVLDAAHGGDDTGGHLASGQFEKAFTLAFAVRLRSLLAARGIQVALTRDSDVTLAPGRRAELANHARAQACLSLHASEAGSGVHLFVSDMAPTPAARLLPWKTAQSAWVTRSLALAGTLNSALGHAGVSVLLDRIALPGIDSMTCPAVAVEIAPQRDLNRNTAGLDNADYQAKVADALAAALLEWRSEQRQP